MIIDHLGIVVPSLEDGIKIWENMFGYRKASEIILNMRQKVRVVFLFKDGSLPVKLIEPSEPSSVITPFARRGGGIHHLCFRCSDMTAEIPALKSKGAKLMVAPEPGEAFANHAIAFLVSNNIQFELIDTHEKAGLLAPSSSASPLAGR